MRRFPASFGRAWLTCRFRDPDGAGSPASRSGRSVGGEEFALLLPNTNGCAEVGERVRELGMLHALNPPSRLVTVSGGTNFPATSWHPMR
jgi:hypothetical protein